MLYTSGKTIQAIWLKMASFITLRSRQGDLSQIREEDGSEAWTARWTAWLKTYGELLKH
jgi:hypothetical protein